MKRIVFFVHYDQHNLVDPSVEYYLTALKEQVDEMVIISNSALARQEKEKLLRYTTHVIIRENREVDFGAWREGLNQYGWNNIKKNFDQLLLINDSCYGPISGSFSPLFDIMDKQPCDFWGITTNYHYYRHLQSYFLAFNKKVFCSNIFKKFITAYHGKTSKTIIKNGECRLTHVLNQAGFRDACYSLVKLCPEEIITNDKNLSYLSPKYLLEYGNLLIKKKIFIKSEISPESTQEAISYIKEKDPTLEKLIRNHVRRVASPNNQVHSLSKLLVLNKNDINLPPIRSGNIAVLCHLSEKKMMENISQYLVNIPCIFDLLITLPNESNSESIQTYFKSQTALNLNKVIVKNIPDRGGNIASFILPFSKIIHNYDAVCRIHTTKIYSFDEEKLRWDYLLTNLLGDQKVVKNILSSFFSDKDMGIIFSPLRTMRFFNHYNTWRKSREKFYFLRQKMMNSDYLMPSEDDDFSALIPYDDMFWFRPVALSPIFSGFFNFDYKSFKKPSIHDEHADLLCGAIKGLLLPICLSQGYDFCYALQEKSLIRNYLNFEKYIQQNAFNAGVKRSVRILAAAVKRYLIFRLRSVMGRR